MAKRQRTEQQQADDLLAAVRDVLPRDLAVAEIARPVLLEHYARYLRQYPDYIYHGPDMDLRPSYPVILEIVRQPWCTRYNGVTRLVRMGCLCWECHEQRSRYWPRMESEEARLGVGYDPRYVTKPKPLSASDSDTGDDDDDSGFYLEVVG